MTIGFIGAGNMATALILGMRKGGVPSGDFVAYDISPARMDAMRALDVRTAASAADLAGQVDVTVLAVKPKYCAEVLSTLEAAGNVANLLSIAVGWTHAMLAAALPSAKGIVRMMPNTPAQVQEAVLALADSYTCTQEVFDALLKTLSTCGRTVVVPESLFDAVTGISGSGPAYVYMFIEALADGGVQQGLPRDLAYTLAAQTLLGASRMVLETGQHPGALKDAVASPGGTTIEAIYALEKAGLRGAVMDAVDACARKAAYMASQQ
ncbi:pyrroline-5-carboxylate reductase [Eubacteriales bacterium OttesenSCG-928-A19]|nr:pyrroline-5-carboxylate reductase [Eubacteriales bacterium OttesenSCG-928-A19]